MIEAMKNRKNKIGIVIYANPDEYPPTVSAVNILSREFDIIIICRNQNKTEVSYPDNVGLYRLGKLKTSREKESQGRAIKVFEYAMFVLRAIFYLRFYGCKVIYSYDMHGFIAGFFASRLGKRIALVYHNHDLYELEGAKGSSRIVKRLELRFARFADKIVFPDANRAKLFQEEAKLKILPDIAINAPQVIKRLPFNRLKELLLSKGINEDVKVVLYQGEISESHAVLEVIKSMPVWLDNAILLLAGRIRKDFYVEVSNLAETLKLRKRVLIMPFISYSKIFSYTVGAYIGLAFYKAQDINKVFNAGASNKIFEYLAMGVPTITNDSPYLRNLLESSYVYFAKPDYAEDIGRVIKVAFLDGEGYMRKRIAARNAHLDRFNYEEQFGPVIEYIRGLIDRTN